MLVILGHQMVKTSLTLPKSYPKTHNHNRAAGRALVKLGHKVPVGSPPPLGERFVQNIE